MNRRSIYLSVVLTAFLIGMIAVCGTFQDFTEKEVKTASVCDYKVAIIYRGSFRTDEDFYTSVTAQIEWLWKNNREVLEVNYQWDYDMTRTLILRFAVIKFLEEEK